MQANRKAAKQALFLFLLRLLWAHWKCQGCSPSCAKSLLEQILPLSILSSVSQHKPKVHGEGARTDAGWHTPGSELLQPLTLRFCLTVKFVLKTTFSLRMNYFLGGSFIPLSKLKEAQKATASPLSLPRLAYISGDDTQSQTALPPHPHSDPTCRLRKWDRVYMHSLYHAF